jgi:hypothetical protein
MQNISVIRVPNALVSLFGLANPPFFVFAENFQNAKKTPKTHF